MEVLGGEWSSQKQKGNTVTTTLTTSAGIRLREPFHIGPTAKSPSIFRPETVAKEITHTYSLIDTFLREHETKGTTSWQCHYADTGEEFTINLTDLDAFMAKAVALHRFAE